MRAFIEEMTTFAVVAETGSFTAAAKKLKKSKAYVSLQVSRLEEAIGLQLLFRTTRKLELTESGRTYVDFCKQLLATTDDAAKAVDVLKGGMKGIIRLSVPVSFGQIFVTDIISKFQEKYPDIQFKLELHNGIRDLKVEGFDLAIRISNQLEDSLVAIKIGELKMMIYGSPDYFDKYGRPETPDDLLQHTAILHDQVDTGASWPFMFNDNIIRKPINWKMVINHYLLIKEATLQGKGLAHLPTYLIGKELQDGQLDKVLTDFMLPPQPIYLVYDYQGVLPLKNRKFIDFVKEWFSNSL